MAATNAIPFNLWLKRRRKELDLTQWELAERVGCSEIAVAKLEAGERRPSRQVAELLADILGIPADEQADFVRYARRSPRPDKGVVLAPPGPEPVEDESKDRAPWRALQLGQTNLPAVLTPLIGREQDEEELHGLLLRKGVRLLTLVGPPGIGKTRLGIEVAADLLEQFEDGVFFVGLAPVSERHMVIPAIAGALEVRETGGQSLPDTLLAYVRGKRMLLLLDNFEQVLDAGVEVVAVLEGSPWLKVLVTSREALHVRGERPIAVPPLALPATTDLPSAQALLNNPAVELFVERAQAAKPDFELTDTNAQDVASVCVGLEGLPLAIELAAARANFLSPHEILASLDRRLNLLTGGARDLPPRQRTLRSAIQWSYDLLDTREQLLFARLGVFVGGCTLQAATEVCGDGSGLAGDASDASDISDLLASLLDKNLLKSEDAAKQPGVEGAGRETRFVMLETIREYARERLVERGEEEAARRFHAGYYLALAERSASNLRQPPEAVWMDWMEQEYGNLRAALGWATEHDPQRILRLADALGWFCHIRGSVREGRYWLDLALAQATNVAAPIRADALAMAGFLAREMHDLEVAQQMLEESLSIYEELGDKGGEAWALNVQSMIASSHGDYALTAGLSGQSAALYDALGDTEGLSRALLLLGDSAYLMGNYEQAYAAFAEGLRLSRKSGKQRQVTRRLIRLGQVVQAQGYPMQAAPYLTEALELCKQARDQRSLAMVFAAMASVADALGSPLSAARLLAATDALVARIGVGLWTSDSSGYERTLASVRTQLDTETFDAAWRDGQATPLDQMIAEALGMGR